MQKRMGLGGDGQTDSDADSVNINNRGPDADEEEVPDVMDDIESKNKSDRVSKSGKKQ